MNKENLVVEFEQDYKKSWQLAVAELIKKNKIIEELQQELKNKPDAKYTLTTADGKEFTIIQSERIDMQQELNKTIIELQQRIQELEEENNKLKDKVLELSNHLTLYSSEETLLNRIDKAKSLIRYYFTDGFEDIYDMLNAISDALGGEDNE